MENWQDGRRTCYKVVTVCVEKISSRWVSVEYCLRSWPVNDYSTRKEGIKNNQDSILFEILVRQWLLWRKEAIKTITTLSSLFLSRFICSIETDGQKATFKRPITFFKTGHSTLIISSFSSLIILPWTKTKNHPRDSRWEERCSILWSYSITSDQRRARSTIRDCPRLLPCTDRAWSRMTSHVEQRSSRRESQGWFFFCPG